MTADCLIDVAASEREHWVCITTARRAIAVSRDNVGETDGRRVDVRETKVGESNASETPMSGDPFSHEWKTRSLHSSAPSCLGPINASFLDFLSNTPLSNTPLSRHPSLRNQLKTIDTSLEGMLSSTRLAGNAAAYRRLAPSGKQAGSRPRALKRQTQPLDNHPSGYPSTFVC